MDLERAKKGARALSKAVLLAVVAAITKELWEGQPLKGVAKLQTYQHLLTSPAPFWIFLIALLIIGLLLPYWWRTVRNKKPELHMAWHGSAGWGIGGILQKDGSMESVLRIQGPTVISSSHLEEPVIVTGIELHHAEYAGPNSQMFEVKPSETLPQHLLLNFRGVTPEQGKAFKAALTLVDIRGKRYPLLPVILRAFPDQNPPSAQPPNPTAVLHASWRADSDWGWATPHPERDPIYMIRGEVTLQMDNIAETVTITGLEIDGAEPVGAFDNFHVIPGRVQTRVMKIYFRGDAPESIDHYTIQLVFRDLRGDRYPTAAHRFKPLPIQDRVEVERGRSLIPPPDVSV